MKKRVKSILAFFIILILIAVGIFVFIYVQKRDGISVQPELPERFHEQWGLKNNGQFINNTEGIKGIDINILDAWNITTGNSEVLVGILDTGIQISMPNISESVFVNSDELQNGLDDDGNGYVDDINGWDFFNNDSSVYDDYLHDHHGTYIASIISSSHDSPIAGIAPDVKIVPLKFMSGSSGDIKDAIKAIEYAHSLGVKIINCSWDSTNYNSELEDVMKKYHDILFICSAGKYKNDLSKVPAYPACFQLENVLCVTAVDNQGKIYDYAGYGKDADVASPGWSILGMYPDSDYIFSDGSSVAAAYVTGIAALIKSVNFNLTSIEIASILKEGTQSVKSLNNMVESGGIVDAYKCIKLAETAGE